MKYLKILFVFLLVFLCGCGKTKPVAESTVTTVPETTEVAETVPATLLEITNKRPYRMLTQAYKLQELRQLIGDYDYYANTEEKLYLDAVHAEFPIECLKENYVIYAVEEGGYYYVLWSAPGIQEAGDNLDLSTAKVTECWYVPRVCTESDFDSIVMGVSTAADVQAIDPTVRIDYGKDGFGSASSRGHEAYCFAALENGEYFFIGFDGDFGDKTALIATEMEIVGPEEACMVWNLDVDERDWPKQEKQEEEADWDQKRLEEMLNPIDGTGMIPLVFVDMVRQPQVGYLICAGNNGQVYIADRFNYNGKSLYSETGNIWDPVDYEKGPYTTEILDLNKTMIFRDFNGRSISANLGQMTGSFNMVYPFLKIKTQIGVKLPEDSRFWFGTYEGVEMFPEDSVYTENGFIMDLDGDGITDQAEIVLTEVPDSYTEDPFTGYTGYYYDYEVHIRRNGRTFRFLPFASWVDVAPDDLAVFAADVDFDGEYEIVEFMFYHKRFGGITIYDFNGETYDELYYPLASQN